MFYARDVLKKTFPAGEVSISKDSHASVLYARDVIKGAWPLGEAAIKGTFWEEIYNHIVIGAPLPTYWDIV